MHRGEPEVERRARLEEEVQGGKNRMERLSVTAHTSRASGDAPWGPVLPCPMKVDEKRRWV